MTQSTKRARKPISQWHWSTWMITATSILAVAILIFAMVLGIIAGQEQLSRQLQQQEGNHIQLAAEYRRVGNLEAAADEYRRAIQINPANESASSGLEIVLQQMLERDNGSSGNVSSRVEFTPMSDETTDPIANQPLETPVPTPLPVKEEPTPDTAAKIELLWDKTEEAHRLNEWQETIDQALQLRSIERAYKREELDSFLFDAYLNLAAQKDAEGNLELALSLVDKALDIRPDATELRLARTQVAKYLDAVTYERADWEQSIALYQELYEQDTEYRDVEQRLIQAHIYYGDALMEDEDGCKAALQYESALDMGALKSIARKETRANALCKILLYDNTLTPEADASEDDEAEGGESDDDESEDDESEDDVSEDDVSEDDVSEDDVSEGDVSENDESETDEQEVSGMGRAITDTVTTGTPAADTPTDDDELSDNLLIPTPRSVALRASDEATPTPAKTATPTSAPTRTSTPTGTATSIYDDYYATLTAMPTATLTPMPTPTPPFTLTPPFTPTFIPTSTPVPTWTPPPTNTLLPPTWTPTPSATWTPPPTSTWTPTIPPTLTPTRTLLPTFTPIPTSTPPPPPTSTSTPEPIQISPISGRILYAAIGPSDNRSRIYAQSVNGSLPAQMLVEDGRQPAMRGDGQRIAYQNTRSDMGGVSGFDPGSGLRLQFTKFPEDQLPGWNGAGNRIVFASNREGDRRWRLYLVWADGNSEATLLGYGQQPAWHPNQERVAFRGCDETGNRCGIWATNSNGGDRAPLTTTSADSYPAWSPDGQFVVFMSNSRDGNHEIYRVNAISGEVLRLTNNFANDGLPVVSPDGNWVAFMSDRSGVWALWATSINGGEPQLIAAAEGRVENWLEQRMQWIR